MIIIINYSKYMIKIAYLKQYLQIIIDNIHNDEWYKNIDIRWYLEIRMYNIW